MNIKEEISFLIHDLMENDQPAEEIANQVVRLIRTKDVDYIIQD